MSLHKILVPVNYSKCSINGLLYAAHLAKELNAKILILHALNNNNVASDAQIQTEIQRNKDKINMYCQDEPCLKDIMTDIFISTHSAKKAIKMAP